MSRAEEFIESYTRNCSNEIDQLGADIAAFSEYHPWITPDQALRAVEIERKETIDKVIGWIEELNNNNHIVRYSDSCEPPLSELTEWFKNYMKE